MLVEPTLPSSLERLGPWGSLESSREGPSYSARRDSSIPLTCEHGKIVLASEDAKHPIAVRVDRVG